MQGDPLAMSMFALGVTSPIKRLGNANQVWFADDAAASGNICQLKEWWDKLKELRPAYGYYPNSTKTWIIVKDDYLQKAKEVFEDSGVNITTKQL